MLVLKPKMLQNYPTMRICVENQWNNYAKLSQITGLKIVCVCVGGERETLHCHHQLALLMIYVAIQNT